MRNLKATATALSIVLSALFSFSQTPEQILDSVNAGRKPEKIFTHFDKPFYLPGERAWFKTYITVDGRPGILSTVVKAELFDESGALIDAQTLPVSAGTASGSLLLPAGIRYGSYVFRLYTQQVLQTTADNFYYKVIPILPAASEFLKGAPVTDISLGFFAESGTFLANEVNILAFSATDQQGRPATVNGVIKNSQGKEVASFATEYNGMGRVEITPEKGEQYTAYFTLPSGSNSTVKLPAVSEEGTNLLVVDEVLKKRLIVNSRSSGTHPAPHSIIGEMDQTIVFKIDISKSNGHYMGRVPVQNLPGGLLHIAVFSEDNKVLAERTCFINSRQEAVVPSLSVISTGIGKREQNSFEFMLPDSLEGTFSLSVTDMGQTRLPVPQDNIITATLITSNLKYDAGSPLYDIGQITGTEKNDAADLLLLTHEYKWNWATLKKLAALKLPPEKDNYIPLRGKAYADRANKPLLPTADLAFIVQTKDSAVNSFVVTTDKNGYFTTPELFFEDTADIYVKNNTDKTRDKKVQLEVMSSTLPMKYNLPVDNAILPQLVPLFLKNNLAIRTASERPQPAIDFDTTYKTLQELVVKSKSKNATEKLEQQYTRGLFSGQARTTIDFVNNKPTFLGGNIFEYLKGRYSYIQVMGTSPNYTLVFRSMFSLGSGSYIGMSLYLDEMPVDASTLCTVPMKDIALVRIYGSGIMGTGGAVAVYTLRESGEQANVLFDFTTKMKLPGFSKTIPFYSPDYKTAKNNIRNDNRKTLYWDPSLVYLPDEGKVPVSFFNSDTCREYRIVIQGFTMNGKLVYMEKTVK